MTRGSIREYTEAVRGRYLRATKKEKGGILDEFTKVIGCHRKVAIRLLRRANQPRASKNRGRPAGLGLWPELWLPWPKRIAFARGREPLISPCAA